MVGSFTSKLSDLDRCDPLENELTLKQDSFLQKPSIRCSRRPRDTEPTCSGMPEGGRWNFPQGFTFYDVPLHLGGRFELVMKCNRSLINMQEYLIVVKGYPRQPTITSEPGNGDINLTCYSTPTTTPPFSRKPLSYSWTINGEVPRTQGYAINYFGETGQEVGLTTNRLLSRCRDRIECSVTEQDSFLKVTSSLIIDRPGYYVKIQHTDKSGKIKLQCVSTPFGANISHMSLLEIMNGAHWQWYVDGHLVNDSMEESGVEINDYTLVMSRSDNRSVSVVCVVTDRCNRSKSANIIITPRPESTELPGQGTEIPAKTWLIITGSGAGVLLLLVMVVAICVCRCKKSQVEAPVVASSVGSTTQYGESITSYPAISVYDSVRDSMLFPDAAVAEFKSIGRSHQDHSDAFVPKYLVEMIKPVPPARYLTYNRALESTSSSMETETFNETEDKVFEGTVEERPNKIIPQYENLPRFEGSNKRDRTVHNKHPERPYRPARSNLGKCGEYIQTHRYDDHVYDGP